MALSCFQIILMVGMLVTGSINTLSKKAQNDCKVEGYPDKSSNNTRVVHEFNHPWFQTLIMFFGEMICLLGYIIVRKKERDKLRKEYIQQNKDITGLPAQPRIIQFIIAVPTFCDLIGTSVAGIGLVYVDASVWQMLRGSIIIFAGILSKIFLKRKLRVVHWCGMLVTMCGLVLVGCSSVFKAKHTAQDSKTILGMLVKMCGLVLVGCSSVFKAKHTAQDSKTILGIILILASQIVSASQMVIEEMFLKKRSLHPLQVVGMEGSFGAFLMIMAVLPAMYFIPGSDINNSYENSLDAMYQIYNDSRLLVFCLLYLSSIAFYNYFGLAVTKSLTAVHRTLIDAFRTILVWVIDLLIHYAFDQNFGEPFDKTYGLLQVDGFFFLLIGTALYNELVVVPCIPCLRKPDQVVEVKVNRSHQGNIQYGSDSDDDITINTGCKPSYLMSISPILRTLYCFIDTNITQRLCAIHSFFRTDLHCLYIFLY